MCDLCGLHSEVGFGNFFVVQCRSCEVPMIVLAEHRGWITPEEFQQVVSYARAYFPGYSLRGAGMRSIPSHWHEHLCPPGRGCPL